MYGLKRMCERLTQTISKKTLVILLAVTMMLAGAAGGTIAYLHSGAQEVKNTFTFGDISITLQETDTGLDGDDDINTNQYQMNIGEAIAKDPTATVLAGSVDCWLYVKVDESENFADFMEYAIADGWTLLNGEDNIYWRYVPSAAEDQSFQVLADDTVYMKESVTLADLATLTEDTYPTLTFVAGAVQYDAENAAISTAEAAWQTILAENSDSVQ